jgi:soluble lytic murein transglycosylase
MKAFVLSIFLLTGAAHAADALLRDASEANKRRDLATLNDLIPKVRGHVLEAYPQYWALRMSLGEVPAAQIEAFSKQFSDSVLANQLRSEWLVDQSKAERWDAWTDAALTIENENGDFNCFRAQWQLRNNKMPATPPAGLWAERLTDACAQAFAAYARAGQIKPDEAIMRFRLAADGATQFAAKEIANILPANIRPDDESLNRAHGQAMRLLTKPIVKENTKEALLYALGRLARQDVELAEEAWQKIRKSFTKQEQSWAALQLGVYGARQHHPYAVKWLSEVEDVRVVDAQAVWWVRAALRAENWAEVVRATDVMSEAGRKEPTWTYWRARGLAATGKAEAAKAEFASIKEGFSFYNWLAAEELQTSPQPSASAEPTAAQVDAYDKLPAAQRVVALSKMNLRFEAAREWANALKDLPDKELIAAAAWMQKKNVWDRSIGAAVRTKTEHDAGKRYAVPFREPLYTAAKNEGLEPALVAALTRQESRFAPDVISSAGAVGLMQLMPSTAKWVATKIGRTYDRDALTDPTTNAQFGAYYLRTVMSGLANSPVMGLAAYNAGPGRAKNWQANKPLEGAIYAETILFNETRDYVKQVLVGAMWIDRLQAGGKGPSLKTRLGTIPARGASLALAKDTP